MAPRPTDTDALRALLARHVEEITNEAIDGGGEVAAARLEAVSRLVRLVEMREATVATSHWRRAVPLVAITTLVVASVLLFVRVPSTQVEMNLAVSELRFSVPSVQVFSDPMSLSALGVSGVTAVDLPGGTRLDASDLSLTAERGVPTGTLDLDALTLPAGARVAIRSLGAPHHYELIITGGLPDLVVAANGAVRIVVPPDVNVSRRFPTPQRIGLAGDSAELRLDVTLAGTSAEHAPLRAPLPIDSLRVYRIDQFQGPDQTVVREVSTIGAGTIYFESIKGLERPVRSGEELRFAATSGEVRQWWLDSSAIGLRFRGTVRDMTTGVAGARRSLMPTMLEWLRARHGVELLWATTAYVVGVFVTVLGWWKRR